MTPVTEVKEQREQQHHADGQGMKPLAKELVRYHTQPAPETAEPIPRPFPSTLWYGLWGGIVVGALLGLLFGWLLFSGTIAPRGWEGVFSLGPFTFHFFWTALGAALGLLIGGVAAILLARPEPVAPREPEEEGKQ